MTERAVTVEIESRGAARIVRVNRPAARNALDRSTMTQLAISARRLRRDGGMRGIVLTGAGDVFLSGGDLREFARLKSRAGARALSARGAAVVEALRACGVPVVAAVNGDVYGGGCELATACDYRVVEMHARFHWVQARFAVTTAWGGTARLVQIVGPGVAARWLLTSRPVDAAEALATGFADEGVPTGASVEAACAWIEQVAVMDRVAVRQALALIRDAPGRSAAEASMAETNAFSRTWSARAHHEAVDRFLSRRRG